MLKIETRSVIEIPVPVHEMAQFLGLVGGPTNRSTRWLILPKKGHQGMCDLVRCVSRKRSGELVETGPSSSYRREFRPDEIAREYVLLRSRFSERRVGMVCNAPAGDTEEYAAWTYFLYACALSGKIEREKDFTLCFDEWIEFGTFDEEILQIRRQMLDRVPGLRRSIDLHRANYSW